MSVPVSLRLCCIAAMAPALTEATGQPRIQLPASPPSIAIEPPVTELNGGFIGSERNSINSADIASIKSKVQGNIATDFNTTRGLLKPIQGNGRSKVVYSLDTKAKSFQDLGIQPKLTEILKKIAASTQEALQNGDHQYQKLVVKKMNQPSNGNGPNGTGKKFIRQSSLIEEKALNGHANKQTDINSTRKLPYSRTIIPSKVNLKNSNSVSEQDNTLNMCRTPETTVNNTGLLPATNAGPTPKPGPSNISNVGPPVETQIVTPSSKASSGHSGELRTVDLVKDASRKEFLLERRSQFILRRLRRLQGKQLESQIKSQLRLYVDYQHQNLQTVASRAIRPFGDLQSTLFHSNDVKNLSTSNLVTLVRKLQASQQKQATEQGRAYRKDDRKGVLVMEQGVSSESERKAGCLRTNLRHWVNTVDSDATESSSGGESCEEWEDCPAMKDKQLPLPLYKRAEWKWAVDRAAIVSRWTWLQAQVSDLEYRIRQQSEIHKTIRTSKGVVTLSEPLNTSNLNRTGDAGSGPGRGQEMSPANVATLMINVNKQASRLTQSLGNCLSPIQTQGPVCDKLKDQASKSLNGFLEGSNLTSTPQTKTSQLGVRTSVSTPNTVSASGDSLSVNISPDLRPLDATCVAARCRPVRFYRKRKLLRTAGLHQISHKAARLSSVKCQCYPPVMPCPMCGGRYNNVQRLDAEGMPIMEKVSLLDPAFHPVLSFPQEIALPIHFEALLKSGEWQSVKPQPKATLRAIAAEKRRQKLLNAQLKDQARKNRKNLTKTAAAVLLSSAKLRSKYERSPHKTPKKKVTAETRMKRKELKKRRAAQLAVAALKKSTSAVDTDQDSASTVSGTATPSPHLRGDGHGANSQKDSRKKRFENAYDINNIVIPYSMAAATRVEKLQYKEIQTPEWRVMSPDCEAQPMEVESEDPDTEEDMTDEAYSRRHDASETEERKRFRSFITYPPVRRSRLSRESESNMQDVVVSPESSLNDSQWQQALQEQKLPLPQAIREDGRRRSGSTSRRLSGMDDFGRENLQDLDFRLVLEPWPRRQFPLSEENYEEMKKEQLLCTSGPTTRTYGRARAVKVQDDMEFVNPDCDRADSPLGRMSPTHSLTSESTLEDTNDPEWREGRRERKSSVSGKQRRR